MGSVTVVQINSLSILVCSHGTVVAPRLQAIRLPRQACLPPRRPRRGAGLTAYLMVNYFTIRSVQFLSGIL